MPLAIQGLIGTLAGPNDPGTAFVAFYHDLGEAAGSPAAWGYPRGGMGAVTAALRRRPRRRAPACASRAPVERVLVEDGARARRGAGGREEVPRRVPCCRMPTRGALQRSPGCRRLEGWRQEGPVVKVMLLLDGLPDFPSWPGPEPWAGTMDIGFTLADLDARRCRRARGPARRAALDRGRLPDRRRPDPGAAGPPRAVDVLPVLPGRHRRRRGGRCRDRALRRGLPRAAGPDRRAPRARPARARGRFGLTGGHIFHGEMLGDQLLERRLGRGASAGSKVSTWPAPAPTQAARSRARPATSPRRRHWQIGDSALRSFPAETSSRHFRLKNGAPVISG